MPFGEEHAATPLVQVDGTALPDDIAPLLSSVIVDSSRNVPDMFVLRFLDEQAMVLTKAGLKIGAEVAITVQSSGPGGPVPLLKGEVTAVEAELDPDGFHTVVRGLDKSHRLFRGRRMEAYLNMTPGDIVRKVAGRAGVALGSVTAGSVLEHVAQDNVNDWDFLQSLAEQIGATVRVVDGKLNFAVPTLATTAPSGSDGARENPLVLERGVNLLSLRATVTAAGQVPEVEVRGWDVKSKKEVVVAVPAKTSSAELADVTPVKLANAFGSPKFVEAAPTLVTTAQVKSRAESLADRLASGFAELEGVVHGNPQMKAGEAVTLRQMGSPFDGKYTLSAVRHDFSADTGYVTSFTVAGASERSLFGAVTGATVNGHRGQQGVMQAIVTDIKDPENLGRVKIKLPMYSDTYQSGWARVVALGAGQTRGTYVLPEVGDEVLVAFENGETDRPYVLGGLYNGKDKPETGQYGNPDGKVQKRVFLSRTGMRLEYIETPSAEELVISTSSGAQKIRMVQKSQALIEILSEGPLKVVAKQDVTVESKKNVAVTTSAGNVSVKGIDVSVEGTKSLTLKAPQVTVQGTATTDIKGAQVKVAADAQVEVSGNAMATIRGAIVKIN
ncbi:type IV secretion protein Rhs [Cellulomonas chitinilytica]|uniref:Type IV secretion protein Rhs n=1 Tax=Cellulomonas chitinilytica TaxID=398759 RepID=A0A919U0I7_9CELL|nr:VgrG-related protein [Cellulomonas chitinilytica]GIG22013.1 type IV secretion protein Rhs [Cellulomonas chitinilytica]